MDTYGYRFSVGPWNIHEGADVFGPTVRPPLPLETKLRLFRELGIDAIQWHDDDAVPGLDHLTPAQISQQARALRTQLSNQGLLSEFVAPRLWEHPLTIDGAFTANDEKARMYALDRAKKSVDIAHELDANLLVLWLAREGTYLREAKNASRVTQQLLEAVNLLLEYAPDIRVLIEPKPNEPTDLSYIPTAGHGLALGSYTHDPQRVGILIESAHAILAGLDPADEMSFALSLGKLWSVHLNDQNGLKYDQDRSFGSVDLRRAFNQVRVLDQHQYWETGLVGLDVKALRTQPAEFATKHIRNSLQIFLRLVPLVRQLDMQRVEEAIGQRDYEELDWLILDHLLK